MNAWKDDIGKIRLILTGESSVTYNDDIINIVRSFGFNPQMWKDALQQWGQYIGTAAGATWKDDFINIAYKLTGINPVSWKQAIEYILMFYEGIEPQTSTPMFCFNSPPFNPNAEYLLLSNNYITKNTYLFR